MHIADETHVIAAGTSHRPLCFGARPHDAFLRTTGQLRSRSRLSSHLSVRPGCASRAGRRLGLSAKRGALAEPEVPFIDEAVGRGDTGNLHVAGDVAMCAQA